MKYFAGVLVSVGLCCNAAWALAPVVELAEQEVVIPSQAPEEPKEVNSEDTPIAKSFPEDKTQHLSLRDSVRMLEQEVQALKGELEVQAHKLEQLKAQQLTFYKDIDERLRAQHNEQPEAQAKVEAPKKEEPVVVVSAPTPANPAEEQITYLAAYNLIKSKRYDEALIAMQAFTKHYPNGGYTANAEYWIGELLLANKQPEQAMQHFEQVLSQFPRSSKAAASALKVGYALSDLGRTQEAKAKLKDVVKNYPDTTAAQLAKSKLESL